ncbi:E3 ubiquitin-protein ligase MIB1-like [Octopus sinensis]|uniref:E3 ubiquitin-protein ligase MIB1-like n=1 Tax=Octopus sinensis TaxID=2607531 RepID=A0A7E6EWN7_9MOLL|nr:E3 ubiquitin-protein ligase MIB1-like [Octopus sinensis]
MFLSFTLSRRFEAVELLLSRGSEVNGKSKDGRTPLHLAADSSQEWTDCVRALMQQSTVEVNARSNDGQTPLHRACWWGHLHTVDMLLGHNGIDANVVDSDGDTPLHVAVRGRNDKLVSVMLNQGSVQLDIQNKKKMTPLLEAVSRGHLGMTHKLIALGANINAVDGDGNSCLHLAVKRKVFNSEGAPMDLLNEFCTVLNLKKNRRLSGIVVARYLSSQGADFHHKNNNNNTPLDLIKDPNLRKKLETFSPPQCVFCEDEVATETFFPCKHLSLCKKCCPPKIPKRCLKCGQKLTSKNSLEAPTRGKFTTVSEPTSSKSQPVESPVLDEKFLQDVAQNLGGKWQQVGRELGIKTVRLEIIKNDNPFDTVEQSFQMLWRWFTHCDPETRTHRTLRKALEKCKCFDALECLPQTM